MKFLYSCAIYVIITISAFAQTRQWQIVWDKSPEDDIFQYVVYRIEPAITKEIAKVRSPGTIFVDKNIKPGILYYYKIRAVNTKGISSKYSESSAAAIPGFKNLPSTIGISKNKPVKLLLDKYINDPDKNNYEIFLIDKKSSSKITVDKVGKTIILKAQKNWTKTDTDSVFIKVIDSDGFFNIAKIMAIDESLIVKESEGLKEPAIAPNEKSGYHINIYPKDFILGEFSEITFSNLPENCDIVIFSSFGDLVFSEEEISGTFEWDAENNDGDTVMYGLYIFKILDSKKNEIASGRFRVIPAN